MDNRGFGEGKPGFPYQGVNGNYPGVYYPGQEMVMPYGQYAPGAVDGQFNEHCAVPQQVGPVGGNMSSYGFGANPYMQHYRQHQAHIMQAAYNNAQHQGRVANPQQIADSIYNMAAHAYNYQQQNPPALLQAMPNSYSPGGNGHTLSVRTGHSPADSLHSPAGSTHSIGERPMLSPHVQSTATQMYNYHQQTNHQTNNRLTQPHTTQQHTTQQPAINYYNNGGHPTAPVSGPVVNGCMNPEIDHRQSIERLAAISHPSEQFNHPTQKISPVSTGNNNMGTPQSQFYQQPVPINNMAAPTTCKQTNIVAEVVHNHRQSSSSCLEKNGSTIPAETVDKQKHINAAPSLPQCAKTATPNLLQDNTDNTTNVTSPEKESVQLESVSNVKELSVEEDEETKPKEAAADSGIDSEQIDKDNEEEHDTSTTSNKSENSPLSIKKSGDIIEETMEQVESLVRSTAEEMHHSSDHQSDNDSGKVEDVQSPAHIKTNRITDDTIATEQATEHSMAVEEEAVIDSQPLSNALSAVGPQKPSDLDESFRSTSSVDNLNNSLSNSGASKETMGDESRLPPRKRKQKLSEHTKYLKAHMPLKKRGRPSKETVRLRETAKLALEGAKLVDSTETVPPDQQMLNVSIPHPIKHKKVSSGKDKAKKPVHSGTLLHSPKFNPGVKVTKDENPKDSQLQNDRFEKKGLEQSVFVHSLPSDKKSPVPEQKSNAVLVSPPKKPKASVSEMQKALMRVVSSDATGDDSFTGKRRRGRPLGSKNKKTRLLDYRPRSNSASSSNISQIPVQNMPLTTPPKSVEPQASTTELLTTTTTANTASTSSTATTFQSQKLSSSVQNRVKSLHIRKSKVVSPKANTAASDLKLPSSTDQWACTFCHQISNYMDMGDLFGGYNIQPNMSVAAKVPSHRKTSDLRLQQQVELASRPSNEIWFHEKCIIWAPGVYMVAGKLYGIYEAVTAAFQTTCSLCKRKGAILGCYCKGCTHRYHIHCAQTAECLLNEENFSMLCTKHKDKKIVLM